MNGSIRPVCNALHRLNFEIRSGLKVIIAVLSKCTQHVALIAHMTMGMLRAVNGTCESRTHES